MARLLFCRDGNQFLVKLDAGEDFDRAHRILKGACLQINDRVIELYRGQEAPENVSELERPNYTRSNS